VAIDSYVRAAALGALAPAVEERLGAMDRASVVQRIWSKDPTVWGGTQATRELANRLGWLGVPDRVLEENPRLIGFAEEVREHCDRVVLCGMGGSSLAPEVFWRTHGRRPGFPTLAMLDSTVPGAVRGIVTPDQQSLFVVSSKSGSTVETMSFLSHFWEASGADPSRFVAVTDGGSPLRQLATAKGFRAIFEGDPDVGGRYSALSPFGLVPAALVGVDVAHIVEGGRDAMATCRRDAREGNPGAWLGAVMGEAAAVGRDKLTLTLSPALDGFGLWVEQLVAESTGKGGVGILPVVERIPRSVDSYGSDRLFVFLGLEGDDDSAVRSHLDALAGAGHPVVRLSIAARDDLGGEFFRWEFATAVAGHVLGVNPFDQPNVAESKANTQQMLGGEGGTGPSEAVAASRDDLSAFVSGWDGGDYAAILAYTTPAPETDAVLETAARGLQERSGVAVSWGYGPRYLHSTGQFHKGGPQRGHFILVVEEVTDDLPIPGQDYTFGQLVRAQAEGDARAVLARDRPLLRVPSLEDLRSWVAGL
jgi:glucose-6-phosphate isomerase